LAFIHIYTVDHSRVQATRWIYQNVPGPFNLKINQGGESVYTQPMPYQGGPIAPDAPYDVQFTARATGELESIVLAYASDPTAAGDQTVTVNFFAEPGAPQDKVLATATLTANFTAQTDPRGASYTLTFDNPVTVEKDKDYFLRFNTTGFLQLGSVVPVSETTWDDGLPLRMDGYDGFAGMYQGDHNFEMYWDDNSDKLIRFTSNLDAGDYIFISSNRQWGTTTRVPERYPLTTTFYRNLIGCPPEKSVITCYTEAKPGTFPNGPLGYELVKVFESYPTLGPWVVNDQPADEAFTVYDHPKVLIFKKHADYSPEKAQEILGAVDLTKVVRLTPLKAASYRTLMLPEDKFKADQAGGTWSDLFSYEAIQNKVPLVGLLIWYLAIAFLGWAAYFFLRLLLPGLPDRGYPLARTAGLLLLAYFAWIVGSLGGEYSRLTIGIGYGLIVLAGLVCFWFKRDEVIGELRSKAKYFLSVEGIFLAFFLIDFYIRFANPDLWHPGKGGERPMDFAYLNAVIKSSSFPPYDPWFSGGYINYYYWGFVLVGTPIKLLGIVPSIAFNFVLPTLFAMLALGGFSVAWNLVSSLKKTEVAPAEEPEVLPDPELAEPAPMLVDGDVVAMEATEETEATEAAPAPEPAAAPRRSFPADGWLWIAGIAAGVGLVLLGNLATLRMFFDGVQRMVVPNELFNDPNQSVFNHISWFIQGIPKLLSGQSFPFYGGDWYWTPSRAISTPAGGEITEFPLFTFIYSDLHAHMMALPLTVLVIAWALSMLMARNLSKWSLLGTVVFGGLAIGALRPTNTWDFPTYLALGSIVAAYAIFRYANVGEKVRFGIPPLLQRVLLVVAGVGLLAGTSVLFFQPFATWFGQGYNSIKPWTELRSPVDQYWSHWGFFLFILASWMVAEAIHWMANTPLSALSKLKPYVSLIWIGVAGAALAFLLLVLNLKAGIDIGFNVGIAWIAVPLLYLALILILRPDLPDVKRLVLFMVATGLAITIFVEVVVLDGDIGRMNTVFKFYLQVWVMFAISSAAALVWILSGIRSWVPSLRISWSVVTTVLFACAAMFIFTGGVEKMGDRMTPGKVPPTLDSMDYMNYARYSERDKDMDLSQDFRAIRWMQDNIKGSPVVLEAAPAGVQYTWFSRYSIYTGLPTVVGWQWHQEQQRLLMPQGIVAARGQEAQQFYRTTDLNEARDFLKKYDVSYIVVGQLERAAFPEGMAKFDEQENELWQAVYRDEETVIYQVIR
jgi:YYY domain-containing protein